METDLSSILAPWFREYHAEIRNLAREALAIPEKDRDEWIHQTIDGHEWVIYTFKARCVLIATDNPDAYMEDFGEPPPTVEAQAYAAMMRDVREAIERAEYLDRRDAANAATRKGA